jgi:hypothetical protein
LPLCLYFHPKILAAGFIHMAALWRQSHKLESGLPLYIGGHPWFKMVDACIEEREVKDVIERVRLLYVK